MNYVTIEPKYFARINLDFEQDEEDIDWATKSAILEFTINICLDFNSDVKYSSDLNDCLEIVLESTIERQQTLKHIASEVVKFSEQFKLVSVHINGVLHEPSVV